MLRTIGRIGLIAVGILMIASGIGFMVSTNIFAQITSGNMSILGELLFQIVMIIAGLSASFAGIGGRGGFWFTIFSLIMLGFMIYYIVSKVKAGTFDGWNGVGQFCVNFALQIAYVVGFIFLKLGNRD